MKVIFAGFEGINNSAKILLDKVNMSNSKVYMPNDKEKSFEVIKPFLIDKSYVICVGQKPLLKDKLSIEKTARMGDKIIKSNVQFDKLERIISQTYKYKYSENAGTSYCNSIYYKILNYIQEKNINVQVVFIHIPQRKNISNFNLLVNTFENILIS